MHRPAPPCTAPCAAQRQHAPPAPPCPPHAPPSDAMHILRDAKSILSGAMHAPPPSPPTLTVPQAISGTVQCDLQDADGARWKESHL